MQAFHKLLLFLLMGQNVHGAKILHGIKVSDDDMLYMASVQNNGKHICGGILISEDFVLTAAHCDKATSVVLGAHDLRYASDDMRYDVKQCKHPNYVRFSQGNDIMLLKLSRKAQLGDKVKIIELPSGSENLYDHQMCIVAGWGYIKSHGSPVNELLKASVPIINSDRCNRKWGKLLPHSVLCAGGFDTNKGFCQCDSGGPLVCNRVPVGIVSMNRMENCDYPDFPNVYTDTSKFLTWIKGVLDKQDC